MANRRYEEQPEAWNYQGPQGRHWRGSESREPELQGRPGGGYGVGGAERGYNQGGRGHSGYEEGYRHRSYDRLLDARRDTGLGGRPRALGRVPKGYVRTDERLREEICERLIDSPYDASDVDVQVKDGEVTLEGTVKDRQERRDIEDLAASVRGVHDVHNRVRVARGGTERPLHS